MLADKMGIQKVELRNDQKFGQLYINQNTNDSETGNVSDAHVHY